MADVVDDNVVDTPYYWTVKIGDKYNFRVGYTQITMYVQLSLNQNRIRLLADPVDEGDGANKRYVDNNTTRVVTDRISNPISISSSTTWVDIATGIENNELYAVSISNSSGSTYGKQVYMIMPQANEHALYFGDYRQFETPETRWFQRSVEFRNNGGTLQMRKCKYYAYQALDGGSTSKWVYSGDSNCTVHKVWKL